MTTQESKEAPKKIRHPFNGWAIRIRRRAGFGWGEPCLAGDGLFAWVSRPIHNVTPIPVAIFNTFTDANRQALKVRSRKLSARPVFVTVEVEATL